MSGLFLITENCNVYTYGVEAILLYYGQGNSQNKVIFSGNEHCAVRGMYRSNATLRVTDNRRYLSRRVVGRVGQRYRSRARWMSWRSTTRAAARNR